MSCNGCRVLRKGCSESCILRPCLQWIESADAQGHATVFVAKFFGRAGLMGFISAVPEYQRAGSYLSILILLFSSAHCTYRQYIPKFFVHSSTYVTGSIFQQCFDIMFPLRFHA